MVLAPTPLLHEVIDNDSIVITSDHGNTGGMAGSTRNQVVSGNFKVKVMQLSKCELSKSRPELGGPVLCSVPFPLSHFACNTRVAGTQGKGLSQMHFVDSVPGTVARTQKASV